MKRELKRETRVKRQMQRERACTAASRFNRRVRATAIARMPVGCSRSAREVRHSNVARLDTGWHAHPKLLGLGLAAMGLHAWSISYCDAVRSDGFIPSGAWPSLPGVKAAVAKLHAAGLWEACEGGYRLHDYGKYNRSKAQIELEQLAATDRKERWLERRSGRRKNGVGNAVTNGV